MSFAQGSLVFSPHNYLYHDASRQTAQQVRIRYNNDNVTEVETFGAKPLEGMVDLVSPVGIETVSPIEMRLVDPGGDGR